MEHFTRAVHNHFQALDDLPEREVMQQDPSETEYTEIWIASRSSAGCNEEENSDEEGTCSSTDILQEEMRI